MRLLKRFLRDIGSKYKPVDVVNINNKRFSSTLDPPIDIPELVYTGTYLGQNKQRFEPSSILFRRFQMSHLRIRSMLIGILLGFLLLVRIFLMRILWIGLLVCVLVVTVSLCSVRSVSVMGATRPAVTLEL